jgi:hypothetical protein
MGSTILGLNARRNDDALNESFFAFDPNAAEIRKFLGARDQAKLRVTIISTTQCRTRPAI